MIRDPPEEQDGLDLAPLGDIDVSMSHPAVLAVIPDLDVLLAGKDVEREPAVFVGLADLGDPRQYGGSAGPW